MTWAGRRLRQAGKMDAAIRAYRLALEIASRARLQEIDAPTFEEETQRQTDAVLRTKGPGSLEKLFASDDLWEVK